MKRILTLLSLAVLATLTSCKGTKALLPNVSGKAGEVLVVLDKSNWEGALGEDVRSVMAADCPMLPQPEPLYSLINVLPSGFTDLFKVHRNILLFQIDPQNTEEGVSVRKDVWSEPQLIVAVSAWTAETADSLFKANSEMIVSAFEQIERNRVIQNTFQFEKPELYKQVCEVFGGSPHFPTGSFLKKKTDDFVWISEERQYTQQAVIIYKYPALQTDNFTLKNIIEKRNEILKANIPGMFDNTYMTTGTFYTPITKYIKFQDREFAETRGLWEVYNDYMGGPFVSHSFYSPDGKEIIVAEAFVYAPRFEKRQYMRQTESLLWSWEWAGASSK